ncbi:hypothetical protein CHLNCDRAFT_139497 [Chlorella variabilis]|uniref:CCD97-like C-terminal domain-containing protein n=1 Tax=Chlorella variabilis TaxID=554065 RepID=E1ZQA3_CHLVA|nr:hypothetical protein CHLNCDRAFT_139497 [Chlorella variabilis]EFN51988.1 hypothetical protein CHLNCDRAFT_139497 [Chlorella variabilis]|eukprot:XP_005844090.1 hypothetical protein CHLNCDRAFT_139497 [Chlorella variabilis]
MGNDTRGLPSQTIQELAARLATLTDLRLPAQLRRQEQGPSPQERLRYLTQLLLHDPGVFLERHGSSLTSSERLHFHSLRGDYEVDFYLKMLEEQEDQHKRETVARNRRLAYMNRLVEQGAYFSEKEMRERQPGIYHQYIGQYRPPEPPQGGEGCQAGTILAESIMRQQEELAMRQRQASEQRQWDQVEEESEEESEEGAKEGGKEPAAAGGQAAADGRRQQQEAPAPAAASVQHAAAAASVAQAGPPGDEEEEAAADDPGEGPSHVIIPKEEQQENDAAFLDIMQQRFLAGRDAGVDYAAIDADAELDEDWAEQAGRDAEDKYFDD